MTQPIPNEELVKAANYGFTEQGAAIVDAIWFTSYDQSICLCLILNPYGVYKAYIRAVVSCTRPSLEALTAAHYGAKVPYAIAAGAFPGRFTAEEYDK